MTAANYIASNLDKNTKTNNTAGTGVALPAPNNRDMRKILRTLLVLCGLTAAGIAGWFLFTGLLTFFLTSDNRIAKDPGKIVAEAGFSLPDYEVTYQSDNMDRGSSAWSSYEWEVTLREPLAEKRRRKLDKLVREDKAWTYDHEAMTYHYCHEESDRNFWITIYVDANIVTMEYNWWDALS